MAAQELSPSLFQHLARRNDGRRMGRVPVRQLGSPVIA
jgi:hypothetical protein